MVWADWQKCHLERTEEPCTARALPKVSESNPSHYPGDVLSVVATSSKNGNSSSDSAELEWNVSISDDPYASSQFCFPPLMSRWHCGSERIKNFPIPEEQLLLCVNCYLGMFFITSSKPELNIGVRTPDSISSYLHKVLEQMQPKILSGQEKNFWIESRHDTASIC